MLRAVFARGSKPRLCLGGEGGGGRYIGGESGAGVVLGLASLGFFHGGNDSFVMILSKRRFSNWQSQFHG